MNNSTEGNESFDIIGAGFGVGAVCAVKNDGNAIRTTATIAHLLYVG
jgi:hypothetical protein